MPKGDPSVLTGDQALDYVRARYVGEQIQQNDISRIRRQQEFIGALVREVQSAGTLTRLDKVVNFLDAATKSLTTDEEFASVTRIGKVAMQLQNVGLDKIQFVTLPTEYYPRDSEFRGKVFWTPEADQIWKLIKEDKEHPAEAAEGQLHQRRGAARLLRDPVAERDGETPSETPSRDPVRDAVETPSETASPSETATPEAPATTEPDPISGICA